MDLKVSEVQIGFDILLLNFQVILEVDREDGPKKVITAKTKDYETAEKLAKEQASKHKCKIKNFSRKPKEVMDYSIGSGLGSA